MTQRIKQWIFTIAVAAMLVAVMPVAAQTGDNWTCVEINGGSTLNIRSGPGVNFSLVATGQPGDQLVADYVRQQAADGYIWVPVRTAGSATDLGWAILQRLNVCPGSGTSLPEPTAAPDTSAVTIDTEPVALNGVNTDGQLDHDEIAVVARSVVLLANVRNNRIQATGTGTVTSADGMIVTNAHVVEDADIVAVGVLNDINDPPEFLYLGEIIKRDEDVDVALVAIRTDIDGKPVSTSDLDLSYITPSLDASAVYRGDPVYIFGYPGIGNDFLVVTTGSIVSVENGDLFGERQPIWYRTDAEIAPGNSGGLVVNGNGEFVGIPTFVEAEDVTGGRLGGIRPAQVALMAVTNAADSAPVTVWGGGSAGAVTLPVTVGSPSVVVRHGAELYGEPGIAFDVMFTIAGWEKRSAQLVARVYHDDLVSEELINWDAPAQYRNRYGGVLVSVPIEPCCERASYEDEAALHLFLPYSVLGVTTPGTHAFKVQIALEADDDSWQRTLSWEFVTVRLE